MWLSRHAAAAVALTLASITGPLESQDAVDQPLTVTGTLVDKGGRAVTGAEVTLRPYRSQWERNVAYLTGDGALSGDTDSVRSGPDGSFSLIAAAVGPWRLEFALPAQTAERPTVAAPLYLPLLPLVAPVVLDPIELPVWHPLVIKVADPDGQPVEGALVLLDPAVEEWGRHTHAASSPRREPNSLHPRFGLAVTRTGFDGLARFALPSGEADVIVSAAGFALHVARARSGSNVLRLERAAATVFRVRDARDRRAPEVVIRTRGSFQLPLALTDRNGEAAVSVPAEQPLALVFEGAWGESAQIAPRVWSSGDGLDQEQIVDVQLGEAAGIQGGIVDAQSGSLVSGAAVWIRSDPGRSARSDSSGFFRVSAAAHRGDIGLAIAATGFMSANAAIGAGQLRASLDLAIVLEPAAPLNGVVFNEFGQTVEGAIVRAEPNGEGRPLRFSSRNPKRTISAPDGSFWISDAPYGTSYRLTVEAEGYASAADALPPFRRDGMAQPLQVVLSRGRQPWGTVFDPDGAPVAGALIRLFRRPVERRLPEVAGLSFMEHPAVTTASSAHGEFVLPRVALGEYRLSISHREFAEMQETITSVPPGTGQYDLGVFVLSRGEEIQGVVVDPAGRPVAGAKVSSRQMPHNMLSQVRTSVTDNEGRFRLTGLLPVPTALTATADDYPPFVVESVRPDTEELVRMELVEGAVLAGRVVDPLGKTIAGVEVVLFRRTAKSRRPTSVLPGEGLFQVWTGRDGSFRFGNLAPSSWLVKARDEAGRTSIERVDLSRGEVSELDLRLQAANQLVIHVTNHLGEPVANAYVRANPESASWLPAFGRTDASGRAGLQVGLGAARVDVSHPELAARTSEVVLGGGRAEVHMRLNPARAIVESTDGRR